MELRSLITRWGFEVRDEPLKRVEAHLGQIKKGMDFLVGAQVIRKFLEMEQRFTKWAHELNSVSIASNVAAETIQKLTFAGAQFGATQDEITGAMTSLTLKINEAKMGFEGAQRAFSMAGFSGNQIRSWRNGEDALMALADRMKATSDPIRRQAIAAELGVSANSRLYAMLMQGSKAIREMGKEAEDLGVVLSGKQVKSLVDAQNAMSKFFMAMQGIGKLIATYFAPSIKNAVERTLDFYKANKKIIEVQVKDWIYSFLFNLGRLYSVLKFMAKAVLDFAEAHPVLFRRITQVVTAAYLLGIALMALKFVITPIMTLFNFMKTSLMLIRGAMVLTTGQTTILTAAMWLFNAAIAFLTSPITLWIAGITAAIIVIKSLWDMLNGKSFKDTQLGKGLYFLWDMLGSIKDVLISVNSFFAEIGQSMVNIFSKIGQMMSNFGLGAIKKYVSFLGFGGGDGEGKNEVSNAVKNLNSAQSANEAPAGMMGGVDNSRTETNTATNQSFNNLNNGGAMSASAPIEIKIYESKNPRETASQVKNVLSNHLERVFRDTHKSLKSAKEY